MKGSGCVREQFRENHTYLPQRAPGSTGSCGKAPDSRAAHCGAAALTATGPQITESTGEQSLTMKAIFSRCKGASHEVSGKVCQDYCQEEVTDSYTIGVVSDGHGGDRYFRSDVGSKSAVEATLDCVREFVQTADEGLFSGAPLTQCGTAAAEREKNGSGSGDERYPLFRQLFSSIIYKWHERILEDAKRPATPEEREKLPEQVAAFENTDSEGHRTGIEKTYGCTLMCLARTRTC